MNRAEFESEMQEHTCPFCRSIGVFTIAKPTDDRCPHEWSVRCGSCNTFYRWLSKEKNDQKRPPLPKGTIPEVWERFGNYCACCGLHDDELKVLGIGRTVQHAPPYAVVGDKATLLPFCQWCQANSATENTKLSALVKRLRDRHA